MGVPDTGALLALSNDGAEVLQALNQVGGELYTVRQCAGLPELLLVGMAGSAGLTLLNTGFDETDYIVLDQLTRVGPSGMFLVKAHEKERWCSAE